MKNLPALPFPIKLQNTYLEYLYPAHRFYQKFPQDSFYILQASDIQKSFQFHQLN